MVAGAIGERGGASLRSALEALQRRQRGRSHGPLAPLPDYDAVYEYLPQAQPYSGEDLSFVSWPFNCLTLRLGIKIATVLCELDYT